MTELQIKGLDELEKRLSGLIEEIPSLKRELHEEVAIMLKRNIDRSINKNLNDSNGHIKGYQESVVGSRGGYAAIRPQKGKTGADSPGAITNYLENGHRIRPAGGGKDYRPRIKVPYVSGRHFYSEVRAGIVGECMQMAQEFADKVAKEIEG